MIFDRVTRWPLMGTSVIVVSVLGGCAAATAQTHQWDDKAMYPARVRAIVFNDGKTLDAGHWMSWGSWKVRFAQPTAMADYRQGNYSKATGFLRQYDIKGLRCENAVLGTRDCSISLSPNANTGSDPTWCMLVVDKILSIECPARLDLEV